MKHRFCPQPARAEGSGGLRANHTLNQQRLEERNSALAAPIGTSAVNNNVRLFIFLQVNLAIAPTKRMGKQQSI